jgi:tetrahydromethanopterin S-methyltransferase subunit D
MYRQIGLRSALLGASASGVAGSVGAQNRLPTPLRLLLLLAAGGLSLYLTISVTLLVLAVAFRMRNGSNRSTDPTTTAWPTL